MTNSTGISYAYNDVGIVSGWPDCPRSVFQLQLGLGHLPRNSRKEPGVLAPARCTPWRMPDLKRTGAEWPGHQNVDLVFQLL